MSLEKTVEQLEMTAVKVIDGVVGKVSAHLARNSEDYDARQFLNDYRVCSWQGEATKEFKSALIGYMEMFSITTIDRKSHARLLAIGLGVPLGAASAQIGILTGSYLMVGIGAVVAVASLIVTTRYLRSIAVHHADETIDIFRNPVILNNALKKIYARDNNV